MSNTATMTRDEARRAIDRLGNKITDFQNAAYERGGSVDYMESDPIRYAAAVKADEAARLDCYDELARVRELIVGLVAERDAVRGMA
jgi:hypothetical protein